MPGRADMECMLMLSVGFSLLCMMLPVFIWRSIRDATRQNRQTADYIAERDRARSQEKKNGDSAPPSSL